MHMSATVHMARTSKYNNENTAPYSLKPKWRAGLYIRLSREDGDRAESESVSSQRAILQKFVDDNPEITFSDYYIDDGWSGTDFERPSFCRMLADVTGKKINCVVVKDLSRFGRNYVESGKYLETVFPLFDVRFIAVNDGVDSYANPQSMNNVIVPFKNIINDEYCRDISVKVRSALDIRRRQGKFIGSFAAYGYKKDPGDHSRLIIDETAAQTVREIFQKFLTGHSIMGIARELNARAIPNPSAYKVRSGLNCVKSGTLWCDTTVRRILKNEVYIGNLVQKKNEVISHKLHVCKPVAEQNRIRVENTHEAIICVEDFEKTRALLARDTRISPTSKTLSVFSGFIKCADCGRAMQKRTVKQPYKTYDYYVCSTYKKSRQSCSKHAVRSDELEKTVLAFLNKYIGVAVDFDRLTKLIEASQKTLKAAVKIDDELKKCEREIIKIKGNILDLYPDYKDGIIDREQYFALKERYENSVNTLEATVERLKAQLEKVKDGKGGGNEFISVFKKHRGLAVLTREVVVELIENIFIQADGGIEIHLKFKDSYDAAREYFSESKNQPAAIDKKVIK